MKTNRSGVSDSRRVIFIIGLLTAFLTGFLSLPKKAAMRPIASPLFDSAAPNALGRLAFERLNFFSFGGRVSLLSANADGTSETTLAATGTPPLFCGEPAYSPDGTKIAYISDLNVYVMNADGSNKISLTGNLASGERNPSWSATGKIAYERASQIWTMNADGTNQTRFSAITQPSPLAPAWSPDGSKIAYTSGGEIWAINADGTNERRVTNNSTTDADPAWSPDGAKIIFGKGGSGIAVVNLDGTSETNLTNSAVDGKPAWSNDGAKIAFVRRDGANGGIYTMDANGANQIRIVADQISQPGRYENDNPAWQPIRQPRRPEFDFDGDGKADVSVFRPSNGIWYRLNSSNQSFYAVQFGRAGDRLAPADYDGDGKTDIAVFREGASAYFYILNSADNTFRFAQLGTTGDAPAPGDWDGDGKADLAVYRGGNTASSPSNFYYRPSSASNENFRTITNSTGGKPVVGDFDGDGKIDAALFLPSGVWSILRSSDNQVVQTAFGEQSDIPVPADFDGDGKANIAVFRPSNGTWYTSQDAATNFGAIVFGQAGDAPVAADYDGDGRADAAVYRGGTWYLFRSTAGFTGVAFGAAADKPIPNAFVP